MRAPVPIRLGHKGVRQPAIPRQATEEDDESESLDSIDRPHRSSFLVSQLDDEEDDEINRLRLVRSARSSNQHDNDNNNDIHSTKDRLNNHETASSMKQNDKDDENFSSRRHDHDGNDDVNDEFFDVFTTASTVLSQPEDCSDWDTDDYDGDDDDDDLSADELRPEAGLDFVQNDHPGLSAPPDTTKRIQTNRRTTFPTTTKASLSRLEHQWQHLQAKWRVRDRVLRRITHNSQRPAFVALLQKQEQQARAMQQEQLMQQFMFLLSCEETRSSFDRQPNNGWYSKRQRFRPTRRRNGSYSVATHRNVVSPTLMELCQTLQQQQQQQPGKEHSHNQSVTSSPNQPPQSSPGQQPAPSILAAFLQNVRDDFIFEVHTALPAMFSMIVHTLAHHGIFEGVAVVLHELKKPLYQQTHRWWPLSLPPFLTNSIDVLHFLLFLMGFLFIRLSGYLYWWLSDRDYDCVKFDYHNRRVLLEASCSSLSCGLQSQVLQQQQRRRQRNYFYVSCLLWIKRHDAIRATLFTLGYVLVYISTGHFYFQVVYHWFDQRSSLLHELPSRRRGQEQPAVCCWNEYGESQSSPFSMVCHAPMEQPTDKTALSSSSPLSWQQADVAYTWCFLTADSYATYWSERVEAGTFQYGNTNADDDGAPLLSPSVSFAICLMTIIWTIAVLKAYGFVFWLKY